MTTDVEENTVVFCCKYKWIFQFSTLLSYKDFNCKYNSYTFNIFFLLVMPQIRIQYNTYFLWVSYVHSTLAMLRSIFANDADKFPKEGL